MYTDQGSRSLQNIKDQNIHFEFVQPKKVAYFHIS